MHKGLRDRAGRRAEQSMEVYSLRTPFPKSIMAVSRKYSRTCRSGCVVYEATEGYIATVRCEHYLRILCYKHGTYHCPSVCGVMTARSATRDKSQKTGMSCFSKTQEAPDRPLSLSC